MSFCELLNTTLKAQLAELPHLQPESQSLDALVTEVKALDQEQQELKGRLQEITRRRREAERPRSNHPAADPCPRGGP